MWMQPLLPAGCSSRAVWTKQLHILWPGVLRLLTDLMYVAMSEQPQTHQS